MSPHLTERIAAVLAEFRNVFRFTLEHCPTLTPETALRLTQHGLYRADLTVHYLLPVELWPERQPPDSGSIRRWLESRGVMAVPYPRCAGDHGYLVGPIIPVPDLATAFHATRAANLASIMRDGLLPGDPSAGRASTGDRFDCYDNIFVCRELGTSADVGRQGSYSVHWWRGELAKRSSTDPDHDWVVLRLTGLDRLSGLVTNCDYLSQSGIILSGVVSIPPRHIDQAWPAPG